MKKWIAISLLIFTLVLSGFSPVTNSEAQSDATPLHKQMEKKTDLSKGIAIVLATIDELKSLVEQNPDNARKINTFGKVLDENWDLIEKKVEKKYPEDYKDIEESLYPLIGEAQKDKPNIEELNKLIKDTYKKLEAFRAKVAGQ
ncbi:hypothetical protein NC661_11230 [Aquibacillus koreensis]|uniref:Uncharacterized protein n=1 Tax=Aquibacillus koreensis TaxID=279446 RepID=A0A9X4AIF7_9BACI|nr:hypothetical protein [Aquibacillus koreensis]MCT2537712.1 hypothetical protein [Aquibacillus koreensis]MDC3420941.1 hypothetical protein [Aquibacillus koreensis]